MGSLSDLASWDIEVPSPRVEPTPRWIRVRAGDTVIADSRKALLVIWYGPDMLPTYCLPPGDVRSDLLQPSAASAGGAKFLVHHDVHIGDRVVEGVAQTVSPSTVTAGGAGRLLDVHLGHRALLVRGGTRGPRPRSRPVEARRCRAQ